MNYIMIIKIDVIVEITAAACRDRLLKSDILKQFDSLDDFIGRIFKGLGYNIL